MALIEEFEKSGNWLFKYRSYVPLVLFPFAAFTIAFTHPNFAFRSELWFSICLCVSLAGQLVRSLVIGYTPVGTSGRNTQNQVAETINTKGMYSLVRHPLYLGNYLMMAGPFLLVGNAWFFLCASFFYWLYYERIMFAEEAFIRNKFGESFTKWAETVPPFFPKNLKWQQPPLSFSMKNVMKREYSGILSMGVTFAFVNFIQYLVYTDTVYVSIYWLVVLAITLVVCLTLRTLKKSTSVLEVQGR